MLIKKLIISTFLYTDNGIHKYFQLSLSNLVVV